MLKIYPVDRVDRVFWIKEMRVRSNIVKSKMVKKYRPIKIAFDNKN